ADNLATLGPVEPGRICSQRDVVTLDGSGVINGRLDTSREIQLDDGPSIRCLRERRTRHRRKVQFLPANAHPGCTKIVLACPMLGNGRTLIEAPPYALSGQPINGAAYSDEVAHCLLSRDESRGAVRRKQHHVEIAKLVFVNVN